MVNFEYLDSVPTNKKYRNKTIYTHLPKGQQNGFIAQEVQKIFPELVKLDSATNLLAINEVGLIPYLVQAYAAQQAEIETLKKQIAKQPVHKSASLALDASDAITSASTLSQNIPNPFSTSTRIQYHIDNNVKSAQLLLFDMNGKLLQTYPLALGSDKLQIEGSSLQPGMYIYTLVCDGAEIDTKRMILTK